MEEFIAYLRDFNMVTAIIRIFLALLLGSAIGIQREINGHAAGFRTHILVCLGSAMTVMTGVFAVSTLGYDSDPMRIAAQVVSGIGFIGAGTILVTRQLHVKGLTTAAGLWSTAAIGLACGIGFYEGAIVCTAVILVVMIQFKNLDKSLSKYTQKHKVYFEVTSCNGINTILEGIAHEGITLTEINIKSAKSEAEGNVGIEAVITGRRDEAIESICSSILAVDGVAFAIETE